MEAFDIINTLVNIIRCGIELYQFVKRDRLV